MSNRVAVPPERVLRHMLNSQADRTKPVSCRRLSCTNEPPVFTSGFYLANIGTTENPLLLELRLVEVSDSMGIALLMTNERFPRDLTSIAEQIIDQLAQANVEFDAVIAPESLGPKITQEIARIKGPWTLHTSLQKGKLQQNSKGEFSLGPPKSWVEPSSGIDLSSATTANKSHQRLYLDQDIGRCFQGLKNGVLLVDDARLSSGTIDNSIKLLQKMQIPVAAVATVLNEADPVAEISSVPYFWLTKLPLFERCPQGWRPKADSYKGLDYFYLEETN